MDGAPDAGTRRSKRERDVQSTVAKRIVLNVGGELFQTTSQVLCSADSVLRDWVETNFQGTPRDDDGNPFINRDPIIFRVFLNFLRGYRLELNPELTAQLCEDAVYFRCKELLSFLASDEKMFLPGPGVAADGKSFTTTKMMALCGTEFLSSGCHKVTFKVEKLPPLLAIVVLSAEGIASNLDILGRPGCVCYAAVTGEMYANIDRKRAITSGIKTNEGEFVTVKLEFSTSAADITFLRDTNVIHSWSCRSQPLRFAVWQEGHGSVTVHSSQANIPCQATTPPAPPSVPSLAPPPPMSRLPSN